MITQIKMTIRSRSKRIQTLLGPFYAVLFAIIIFEKYRPTYLSSVSREGQLKTGLNLVFMYLEYHKVVVFCQFFWFWREIVFGVTYILSGVQYSCAVVSVFWWEIGFSFTYLCIQSTIQLWCCVSFLVLMGNSF